MKTLGFTRPLWRSLSVLLLPSLAILVSCSSDDEVDELGNWVERSVLDGTPRSSAAAFTLGSRGFMGTGYDGDDYLNDFWIYDIEGNFWSQGASFPGIARSAATSFTINGVGYVGLGLMEIMNWGISTVIIPIITLGLRLQISVVLLEEGPSGLDLQPVVMWVPDLTVTMTAKTFGNMTLLQTNGQNL